MRTVIFLTIPAALCSSAVAHIHSQKVTRFHRDQISLETWVLALISSVLVAAAGIFPLLLNRCCVNFDENGLRLRAVLSFAVGGLLGDVFLHLLPEAWGPATSTSDDWQIGAWVLMGLISFLLVEKVANSTEQTDRSSSDSRAEASRTLDSGLMRNGGSVNAAPAVNMRAAPPVESSAAGRGQVDMRGYLNLVANCTDNFTHGLAIAASYVASPTVGILTTLAILCHEIPHEVGDFAILLSSGFNTWSAAKAQALTATGGLVGVVTGLTAEHLSSTSSWLLPFTAGGFLYIALVSIVPQLLEDTNFTHSLIQIMALLLGVVVMALVSIVEKQSCKHLPSHTS